MSLSETCTNLSLPALVGPEQVYGSLGHWNTAVLVLLALHLLPVWGVSASLLYSLASRSPGPGGGPLVTSASLLLLPPALMSLATAAILAPSLGVYVEILHEVVISFGLVQFVSLCCSLCDGRAAILTLCAKKQVLLPIGSPPLVCLLPLKQPPITNRNLQLMVLAPKLLLLYKSLIFCVEIVYLLVGYTPSGDFVSLDNIHNMLGIPVGLVTIYFYTMFNFVMNKVMAGNSKRFIGVILLLEFILFDCTRLFFIFLTGTGMLQCVPPFLSQRMVEHLVKNYIKAFLATGIGMAMMKLVAEEAHQQSSGPEKKTSMSSLMSSVQSEDVEEGK